MYWSLLINYDTFWLQSIQYASSKTKNPLKMSSEDPDQTMQMHSLILAFCCLQR